MERWSRIIITVIPHPVQTLSSLPGIHVHFRQRAKESIQVSSAPDLPVSVHDELGGGQVLQPHRPEGVQLGRGNADLGPQAELVAVGKPG